MNLPTIEEVSSLWGKYRVPENIRAHMRQVSKVAVFLAKKLKEKGIHVDAGLAERAALLHDLARTANFDDFSMQKDAPAEDIDFWNQLKHQYSGVHHGEIAHSLLKGIFPEVAEVIKAHSIENIKDGMPGAGWEEKLLVYADSRVVHDKIVSMAERRRDSDSRHGKFYENLRSSTGIDYREKVRKTLARIEEEIFSKLEISPEEVNKID